MKEKYDAGIKNQLKSFDKVLKKLTLCIILHVCYTFKCTSLLAAVVGEMTCHTQSLLHALIAFLQLSLVHS